MSILLLQGNLPVTDNPGLDSVDPRYDGIVSYVQEENFIVAITLIEELFEENIFDIRMICYYLYGYWLDNSFASLNEVLQCFNNLLSDNFEAIGPIANREQNFEKSFSWMMRQIFKKITYEEKKNSSLWQQWIASISEEEISQILEAGAILCVNLTQKLNDKAANIIDQWSKIQSWLKALKTMVARPLAMIATETENSEADSLLMVLKENNDLTGGVQSDDYIKSFKGYEASYHMTLLLKKIAAFERMVHEKKFDRAALILDDIKLSLSEFEPTLYLPKIFENFVKLQALNFNELVAYQQQRGTLESEVMQEWFKVDLDGFINS
jgi:hypothetical protein